MEVPKIPNIKEAINNALDSLSNVSDIWNLIKFYFKYFKNKIINYIESNLYSLEDIKIFYTNLLDILF